MKHMGITTKDLAQMCGVSRTTVHRALNGTGRINTETKNYILETARKYDYRPDLLARGLVKGKTYSLGVVVLDVNNRYFSQMLSYISEEANSRFYSTNIMLHKENKEREKEQLERMAASRVDGIILSSVNEGGEYKRFLESLEVPVVCVDNKVADGIPFVGIDQAAAMRESTMRAIMAGYRCINFVCPPLGESKGNKYVHQERLNGFNEIMKLHPECEMNHLLDGNYLEETEKICNSNRHPVFLCTSDQYALEIMKYQKEHGRKAGIDYGIVGFDAIDTLDYVSPRLTTISNVVDEVAINAVNLLFDLIDAGKTGTFDSNEINKNILLVHNFITGETL